MSDMMSVIVGGSSAFVCYFLRWNHERGSKTEQHARTKAQSLPHHRRTQQHTQEPDPPHHSAARLPEPRVRPLPSRTKDNCPNTRNSHASSSASSPTPTKVTPSPRRAAIGAAPRRQGSRLAAGHRRPKPPAQLPCPQNQRETQQWERTAGQGQERPPQARPRRDTQKRHQARRSQAAAVSPRGQQRLHRGVEPEENVLRNPGQRGHRQGGTAKEKSRLAARPAIGAAAFQATELPRRHRLPHLPEKSAAGRAGAAHQRGSHLPRPQIARDAGEDAVLGEEESLSALE